MMKPRKKVLEIYTKSEYKSKLFQFQIFRRYIKIQRSHNFRSDAIFCSSNDAYVFLRKDATLRNFKR